MEWKQQSGGGFREENGRARHSNFLLLVWNNLSRESKYSQFEDLSSHGKLCPGRREACSCVYMCIELVVGGNLIQREYLEAHFGWNSSAISSKLVFTKRTDFQIFIWLTSFSFSIGFKLGEGREVFGERASSNHAIYWAATGPYVHITWFNPEVNTVIPTGLEASWEQGLFYSQYQNAAQHILDTQYLLNRLVKWMPILQMCRRRLAQGNSASKGRHKDSNPRPAWAKAYAAALPFFRCPPLLPIVVIGPSSRHQLFWACQVPNSQTVTQVPQRQGGGDTPLDTALPRHLLGAGGR